MLSAAELAYMRGQQALGLPDTCTLRTVTLISDGSGGWTEGTSDTLNVPCRLMMPSIRGAEAAGAEQKTPEREYTLSVPRTYTLTPPMRVICNSVTYEVISANNGVSWETVRRAILRRVET